MESKTQEESSTIWRRKEHSSRIILPGVHRQMLSQQRPDLTSTWQLPRAGPCPKDSSSQRAPSPVTSKISPFIAALTYCMASNEEFSISNFNAIIKMSIKVFTVWLVVIKNGLMGGAMAESCSPRHQDPTSSFMCFLFCSVSLLKKISLVWVVTVPRAWKKPMKNSLTSHKYNLGLKKSFFSTTPPNSWSSCSAVCGGVSAVPGVFMFQLISRLV